MDFDKAKLIYGVLNAKYKLYSIHSFSKYVLKTFYVLFHPKHKSQKLSLK